MALITCKECGREISSTAVSCPHCGARTLQGMRADQAKTDLFTKVALIAADLLGAYLILTSFFVLTDIPSDYWKYSDDAQSAITKIWIGIGIVVGAAIMQGVLRARSGYQVPAYPTSRSAGSKGSAAPAAMNHNPAFIPEDKRRHGTCAKCRKEGLVAECKIPYEFGDFDLCPLCISRHRGQIR